jgi:thioredoxin reductase (NADPH)
MSQYLVQQINETSNIRVLLNPVITEANDENKLENITIKNTKTGEQQDVLFEGSIVYIGIGSTTTQIVYIE